MSQQHSLLCFHSNRNRTGGLISAIVLISIVAYFLLVLSNSNLSSSDVDAILRNVSTSDSSSVHVLSDNAVTVTVTPIPSSIHIVYFGNSILYVNDCPTVLENMIETITYTNELNNNNTVVVSHDKCLTGGATLTSLWEDKNCNVFTDYVVGEETRDDGEDYPVFKSGLHHNWDYVIMNDQTQSPAREYTREFSTYSIRSRYVPLLLLNTNFTMKPTIPIIIQTAAYRIEGVQYSSDLGTFDQFTDSLATGVEEYKNTFNTAFAKQLGIDIKQAQVLGARIAPVGEAYRWLRNNQHDIYEKLYSPDNYHPSQYGTWLQACVVYIVCFRTAPPVYTPKLMASQQGIPNNEEAEILRQAACHITGISCTV